MEDIVIKLDRVSDKNKWERVRLLQQWLDTKGIPYSIYNMNTHIKIVHKDYHSIDIWPTTIKAHIAHYDGKRTSLDSWNSIITFLTTLEFFYEPYL